jgi:hypothetical protein
MLVASYVDVVLESNGSGTAHVTSSRIWKTGIVPGFHVSDAADQLYAI